MIEPAQSISVVYIWTFLIFTSYRGCRADMVRADNAVAGEVLLISRVEVDCEAAARVPPSTLIGACLYSFTGADFRPP